MSRFVVSWQTLESVWAEVDADSPQEAVEKAKAGKWIERTMDSEPLKPIWKNATVKLKTP